MGILDGKKALITGGARGLGFEIAKEYVKEGAEVLICSRSGGELEKAEKELIALRPSEALRIASRICDVSSTGEVDALFEAALKELGGGLDILVNNAGIQGPIGLLEECGWDELEDVINVDLMGPLYCMRKAVSIFKKEQASDPGSRSIINLSGGGATGARPYFMGYAVAKTGIVRATETLARETAPFGIRVNAIAPGAMKTRMMDEIIDAGERAGEEYELSVKRKENGGDSMEEPAKLAAYLGSDASAHITGRLISAKWDGWREFPDHAEDIEKSDVFTLRRIVPGDRGFDWE